MIPSNGYNQTALVTGADLTERLHLTAWRCPDHGSLRAFADKTWPGITITELGQPDRSTAPAAKHRADGAPPAIFIMGCPRSGTSLVSQMLNSHPRLAVPFESHLYNGFYPWLAYYGDLQDPRRLERLVNDVCDSPMLRQWDPRPDRRRTLAAVTRRDFHGVVDAVLSTWAHDTGKARWGEKTPHHAYYWPQILQGFPDVKVLHIVRDGRDACMSWKKARFGPKHIYPLAHAWKRYLQTMHQMHDALPDGAFLQISYEDLLADPPAVLRRVCAFLSEPYESQMLSYYESGTRYNTDKRNRENLTKPVLRENSGKWRRHMSHGELRIFETIAGDDLELYGYERALVNPTISMSQELRIRLVAHPLRKLLARTANLRGQMDALRRARLYFRLRRWSAVNRRPDA